MNPNTDVLRAAGQQGHRLEPAINDPPASAKISPTKEVPATRRAINKLTRSFRGIQALAKKVTSLSQPSSEKRALALVEQVITSQPQSCEAQVEILALRGPQAEQCVDLMQKMLDEHLYTDKAPVSLRSDNRIELRHLLVRLSKAAGVLPASIFLEDVECHGTDRDTIAGGGFADIFRATYRGQKVALKRLRVFSSQEAVGSYNANLCREALVWKQLCHPNVLPFFGVDCITFKPYICMVSPWMNEGNIMDCLKKLISNSQDLPLHRWIKEIIEGLQYLHAESIVHGDLRGANIMITPELRVQLADFGLAQFVDSTTASFGSTGGAVRWLAPEVLVGGGRLTFASDAYAFGCVCLELYTQKHPFPDCFTDAQVIACILQGQRPKKPRRSRHSTYNRGLWNLVERCWAEDPIDRPPASFIAASLPTEQEQDFVGSDYDIIFKADDPEFSSPEMLVSEVATSCPPSDYSGLSRDRPWSPFSMLSEPSINDRPDGFLTHGSRASSSLSFAHLHSRGSSLSSPNYGSKGVSLPTKMTSLEESPEPADGNTFSAEGQDDTLGRLNGEGATLSELKINFPKIVDLNGYESSRASSLFLESLPFELKEPLQSPADVHEPVNEDWFEDPLLEFKQHMAIVAADFGRGS